MVHRRELEACKHQSAIGTTKGDMVTEHGEVGPSARDSEGVSVGADPLSGLPEVAGTGTIPGAVSGADDVGGFSFDPLGSVFNLPSRTLSCRFSSNLCFSHAHVIRTAPGEKFAGHTRATA